MIFRNTVSAFHLIFPWGIGVNNIKIFCNSFDTPLSHFGPSWPEVRKEVFNPMAYVNVPTDLSKIKTKIAFNLTKRQLICFGIAAVIGIPTYLLTRTAIGNTGAMFLMIGLMIPCFLLAMYERDGLPFEKVLRNIIRTSFLWPRTRPYRTENFYAPFISAGKEATQLATSKKAKSCSRKKR